MDSTIERWFLINSDTLYKMKWVVIPPIVLYFHPAMVNNKKQKFWLLLLVVCVVNYLSRVFYVVYWSLFSRQLTKIKILAKKCRFFVSCSYKLVFIKPWVYLYKNKPASTVIISKPTDTLTHESRYFSEDSIEDPITIWVLLYTKLWIQSPSLCSMY